MQVFVQETTVKAERCIEEGISTMPLEPGDSGKITLLPYEYDYDVRLPFYFRDDAYEYSHVDNEEYKNNENISEYDKTISEEMLVGLALEHDMALAARAFEYNGNYVVAILTAPFYLKSERDKARDEIERNLRRSSMCENVRVCFDTEIYRKIKNALSDEERQNLYELALSRI